MIDQLDTILVHLWFHDLDTLRSLVHFQEDRDVGPLGVLTISIWVHFESPCDAIG